MIARRLPGHEFERQRWGNGLGWTREIIRSPDHDAFDWRASIAEIDHDCSFSPFTGYRRLQVLLDGAGMRLHFADATAAELLPPHGHHDYAGDAVPHCALIDGPVRAFNLIHRPLLAIQTLHRPLVGPMVFFGDPNTEWLLLLLHGRAHLTTADIGSLEAGDALHLAAAASAGARHILDGGGELLAFRIEH